MNIFKGVCTALITPFDTNGDIDYGVFADQIDFQISHSIDALVVLGTTGEPCTLDQRESVECMSFAIAHINKRVPVIVGISSNDTAKAVTNALTAQNLGADCLLVATPYYNKTSQQGLVLHYSTIAQATSLPIIAYNVPSRTGLNMQPQTTKHISKIPNIVGLKEASSNLNQIAEILDMCKQDIALYSGDDSLVVPSMSLGGSGVISVMSNAIPNQMLQMTKYCLQQDYKKASTIQLQTLALTKAVFADINPIGIKTLMSHIGRDSGMLRLPLTSMSKKDSLKIKREWRLKDYS